MVALKIVQTSIEEFKPKSKGFVGVFIGGTSGIGEAAVIGFAKHVEEARLYIVGRNEEAAKSIIARCEKLSPSSKFTFFQQDLALLKDVDKVCAKIQQAEEKIDLLFMTPGYLSTKGRNGEPSIS